MTSEMAGKNPSVAEEQGVCLTAEDHRSLVVSFNNTSAPFPADRTVVDLFTAQVDSNPDAVAIRFRDAALTYADLNARVNQIARFVIGLGAGRGSVIVLMMEHSIEVVCAMLGILRAGAAYVPLDPGTPSRRVSLVYRDLIESRGEGPPIVMTQSRLIDRLPDGLERVVTLDDDFWTVAVESVEDLESQAGPDDLAYVIYTSGSTGAPKGVSIGHRSLVNYITWADRMYCRGEGLTWPLFSTLAFDLTVTSIYTPLISGGCIQVYAGDPRIAALRVFEEGVVDIVKLTPAHLAMVKEVDLAATKIRRLIVGGEEFRTELAGAITRAFGRPVEIFNEYGPTEATVGCMIHRYDAEKDAGVSVPIGVPAANAGIYVLDARFAPVTPGAAGEMFVAGECLAHGYLNRPDLTEERFLTVDDPRYLTGQAPPAAGRPPRLRVYRTGDLARWNADGSLEFLGRSDHQVKIHGARIELGEIEARLLAHPAIRECAVTVARPGESKFVVPDKHCARCGVPSNLPGTRFDDDGICSICRSYDSFKNKAEVYFKTREDLEALVEKIKTFRKGEYDCLVLVSGGKDSSYMLYQLCDMGLTPLAFSLDNGYISEEAKSNLRRMTDSLGVDLILERTPHMNEIFLDSLHQFSNVCNGCLKTVYTLATNIAFEKDIGYIFTGLSRGQFFETRLTEDVFLRQDFDVSRLDELILEARKAYHQRQDAVSAHLAVDVVRAEGIFDKIQFVDFYRYVSVSLDELYAYLNIRGAWTRPSDTGRSTNCLINEVGIYIHKQQRGFHNYALPYSWDVRLGQKTRVQAMDELDDEIDLQRVKQIMSEIGYRGPSLPEGTERIVAYYTSDRSLDTDELRAHLVDDLPDFMLPSHYERLESLPLTANGKIDREALPPVSTAYDRPARELIEPRTEMERKLADIFGDLLNTDRIGIHDDFFELGGHSLLGIRAMSKLREVFGVDMPLGVIFEHPTVSELAIMVMSAGTSASPASDPHASVAIASIPRRLQPRPGASKPDR